MKRSAIVFAAVCSTFVMGCGGSSSTTVAPGAGPERKTVDKSAMGYSDLDQVSPQERAKKIREWGAAIKDKKTLKNLVGKYVNDKDPEVSTAAKEVLQ